MFHQISTVLFKKGLKFLIRFVIIIHCLYEPKGLLSVVNPVEHIFLEGDENGFNVSIHRVVSDCVCDLESSKPDVSDCPLDTAVSTLNKCALCW